MTKISNTEGIDFDLLASSPTVSAGHGAIYPKTDGYWYVNIEGTERRILSPFTGSHYLINRSIVSNDIVVSLKTYLNANPTTSIPLSFMIGGTLRTLTSALSVTVPHGTSIFAAGSSEIKTKSIDLFVYVGYRVSDTSLFVGLARIPFGQTYADFSATSTNEKYLAYSGAAPASTDAVINIGRVSVQNSGSASYNWSVVTDIVISEPIQQTRWLDWTPTYSAGGSMTITGVTPVIHRYMIDNKKLYFEFLVSAFTIGGTPSPLLYMTLSFLGAQAANLLGTGSYLYVDAASGSFSGHRLDNTGSRIALLKSGIANWSIGAGTALNGNGFYEI